MEISSLLEREINEICLKFARKRIAEEIKEYRKLVIHWRKADSYSAKRYCEEVIFTLRELAHHQFPRR